MTIAAYTGLPGHGKSYGVVENVIKLALEQKRGIFTNIPMNHNECMKRFNMSPIQFNTQDIIDNPLWWSEVFHPGAIIVIDELWRLWPSGMKANQVRPEDKTFLAEHRHLVGENGASTEVVFVTQDLSQIASFARSLVETTFRVTKLTKLGLDKRYRVDVYYGAITGASPPISKRDREIHGKFQKEIYLLYKSHTKSVTGDAGNEARIDKRFNVLGGLSIKISIIVIFIALVAAFFGIHRVRDYYGLSDTKEIPTKKLSSKVSNPTNNSQNIPTIPVQPAPPKKEVFQFLSKAKAIYISYNNGHFPKVEYHYKVVFDNTEAVFNDEQIAALEYELYPINECMVKIKGPDFDGFAMCQRFDTQQGGWVQNMVSDTSNSNAM